MSEMFGIGSFLSQHLCSPIARPALAGARVQVQVKTRRLRCRNRLCPRKIFAERLPGIAAPQA